MTYEIHPATLDDTAAIVALFTSRIGVWQRIDAGGHVQTVDYSALNLYERWLYGGAWMSIETGAIHLNHLLMGAGIPLVAVEAGRIVGYGESYHSIEAPPIGSVLHIGHLITADGDALDPTTCGDALIAAFAECAKALRVQQVTMLRTGETVAENAAPHHSPLTVVGCVRRYAVAARTGQVFYRAVDHPNADASVISGWMMPIGRLNSARQVWESLMPRHWDTIPQMRARKTHRLKLSAAGQEAYVVCQQGLYNPRSADVYCWTPKPLTVQLISSIKDWAHRESYRTLSMLVADDALKALGADAEPDGYMQETCALEMA